MTNVISCASVRIFRFVVLIVFTITGQLCFAGERFDPFVSAISRIDKDEGLVYIDRRDNVVGVGDVFVTAKPVQNGDASLVSDRQSVIGILRINPEEFVGKLLSGPMPGVNAVVERFGPLPAVIKSTTEKSGPVEEELKSMFPRLVWENEYGRKTWAYLVKPPAFDPAKRYPMIIVQYSPDECLRGGTGNEFPTHAFAANGFVVLCFSQTGVDPEIYRTLADPHAILRAEYGDFAKHKQSLSSLEAIIDRLAERGVIDPRRVGLTGLSAGVEILQYALIHSRAFAAAATSGGGSEPISYFGSTAFSRESFFHPLGFGNPFDKEQGKNWPQFSLALNTDKIDMPLLIQAADREYLHAIQTVITWNVAKKPIEMRVFPDEHHVKWYPAHRYNVHRRNVDWFNFWLRDVKDPDPTKAAQYERWEKLRRQHRNKEDPS